MRHVINLSEPGGLRPPRVEKYFDDRLRYVGDSRLVAIHVSGWSRRAMYAPRLLQALRDCSAAVALPVTTLSPRWFSAQTSSSTRRSPFFSLVPRTRPLQVITALRRTSAVNRTPSLRTVPAPSQSVTLCATK